LKEQHKNFIYLKKKSKIKYIAGALLLFESWVGNIFQFFFFLVVYAILYRFSFITKSKVITKKEKSIDFSDFFFVVAFFGMLSSSRMF
jgi:hypothetical protein